MERRGRRPTAEIVGQIRQRLQRPVHGQAQPKGDPADHKKRFEACHGDTVDGLDDCSIRFFKEIVLSENTPRPGRDSPGKPGGRAPT